MIGFFISSRLNHVSSNVKMSNVFFLLFFPSINSTGLEFLFNSRWKSSTPRNRNLRKSWANSQVSAANSVVDSAVDSMAVQAQVQAQDQADHSVAHQDSAMLELQLRLITLSQHQTSPTSNNPSFSISIRPKTPDRTHNLSRHHINSHLQFHISSTDLHLHQLPNSKSLVSTPHTCHHMATVKTTHIITSFTSKWWWWRDGETISGYECEKIEFLLIEFT